MSDVESFYITHDPLDGSPIEWERLDRFSRGPSGGIVGRSETDMGLLCHYWNILAKHCQSPIEADLANELYHLFTLESQHIPFVVAPDDHGTPKFGFTIYPQHRVGRYRADLAICLLEREPNPGGSGVYFLDDIPHSFEAQIIVECDGHEFHEKTKEQAAHDKRRDRALFSEGWPVLRFTGSEIRADAAGCARQVLDALKAAVAQEADKTKHLRDMARRLRETPRERLWA